MDAEAGVFRESLTVPADVVDENGHVNNVVYVQWMQDVAVRHSDAVGGTAAMHEAGASWVVRSHRVEYLAPAFAGDRLEIHTWVANVRRVRSLRRYRFVNADTGATLVRGETDWVFVDRVSGRPRAVPPAVSSRFVIVDR